MYLVIVRGSLAPLYCFIIIHVEILFYIVKYIETIDKHNTLMHTWNYKLTFVHLCSMELLRALNVYISLKVMDLSRQQNDKIFSLYGFH